MIIDCRLCGGLAENDDGWPICKGCFDSGEYERWLWGEYRRSVKEHGEPDAEITRALVAIRGVITEHDLRAHGLQLWDFRAWWPRRARKVKS